jgi:membrane protease YdiL (CAAX protease family)
MNEKELMKEEKKIYLKPKFQLLTTYVWFFLGTIVVILIFIIISGFNVGLAMNRIQNNPHLYIFIEFSSVGFFPLLYYFLSEEKPSKYGIYSEDLLKSLLLSFFMIFIYFILGYLLNGQIMTYQSYDFSLGIPWNFIVGIAGIIVWGPLEVFFFIWLIEKTRDAFLSSKNELIISALITSLIFGVILHLITTRDIYNSIYTGIIFLLLSLIYAYTKNLIGPIIAWTLLNGQIWFIGQMLFV